MKRLILLPTFIAVALSDCGRGASSRPSPAVAPETRSAVLDDVLREDLAADSAFPWSAARRLRWSDFRGQPPGGGEEGAKTAYALFYAWKCRAETFEFRVIAGFRSRQSWVKAVILNDSAQNRSALGHEQTHFDLVELHARSMRQYFSALPDPCRKTDPELTALARGLLQEEKAEQRRYDLETGHGLDAAQQARWSREVSRRLGQPPTPTRLSDAVEPQAVLRAMTVVADWQLANPSSHKPNEWQQAPFWAGLYELALRSSSRQKYVDAIRRNGESVQWQPGPQPFLADDHAVTQSYFLLYRLGADRRMIEPALSRFGEMLRAPFAESLEWSEARTLREWVWCDALFMSPPALALATSVTGDGRYVELMARLWWKTTDYLYDTQERLFYRDSRFFDQRERNGQKVFWSRGNGWVLAGLARVLQYLPPDYPGRRRFVALFQEMAQRIAKLQGPDGYWRASLLDPDSRPIPETSGTGFFTYALAWGMNEGLLGREYEPTVRRGWSALVRAVRPGGKLGYVQRIGDQPGDTGPEQTEIYGTGAFLLAGSEIFRLAAR